MPTGRARVFFSSTNPTPVYYYAWSQSHVYVPCLTLKAFDFFNSSGLRPHHYPSDVALEKLLKPCYELVCPQSMGWPGFLQLHKEKDWHSGGFSREVWEATPLFYGHTSNKGS